MAIPGVWGDESGRLHLEWVGSEGIPSRGGLPWIVSLSGRSSIPPPKSKRTIKRSTRKNLETSGNGD